jgi:hypothetical protein
MAVSTKPNKGTVMLATIAGNAILKISRFTAAKVLLFAILSLILLLLSVLSIWPNAR